MIPWALKMPIGHLVDLLWRHKAGLVYLGAALIAASLAIMIGLIGHPDAMRRSCRPPPGTCCRPCCPSRLRDAGRFFEKIFFLLISFSCFLY